MMGQSPVQPTVAAEKPVKKNDAWGLGDDLVNLTNLNKSANKYAAFDPNSKNNRPRHMLPNLNNAPHKISFTSFNTQNMQPNPMMGARMPPNQQMMGRGQPQMGMGMQYP